MLNVEYRIANQILIATRLSIVCKDYPQMPLVGEEVLINTKSSNCKDYPQMLLVGEEVLINTKSSFCKDYPQMALPGKLQKVIF